MQNNNFKQLSTKSKDYDDKVAELSAEVGRQRNNALHSGANDFHYHSTATTCLLKFLSTSQIQAIIKNKIFH
jgi:hypothetical protein